MQKVTRSDKSQLIGFSMMGVFTERCLRADFHFNLNVNVNVTDDSCMNSTSRETILRNFLQQWKDLNIFRIVKPESTSKAALFETNSQILLFFIFFFYVFLKHKHDMRFTLEFIHTCDDLVSFRFNYLCKFHTIPKLKRMNNKSFFAYCLYFLVILV